MARFNFILIACLFLTSCFRAQTRDLRQLDGSELASFDIKTLSGKKSEVQGSPWAESKTYTMNACLIERRGELPARNETFQITLDTDKKIEAVTDDKGCLSWQEKIEYSALADESYVTFERKVSAASVGHSGSAKAKFAINPWNLSGRAKEVLNLNDKAEAALVPEGKLSEEKLKLLADAALIRPIVVSMLSLVSDQLGDAKSFSRTLDVRLRAKLQVKNIDGALTDIGLANVPLKLSAVLIADIGEKSFIAWTLPQAVPLVLDSNNELSTRFEIGFQPQTPELARYRWAMRVVSESPIAGVGAFDGVFDLGTHAQIAQLGEWPKRLKDSNAGGKPFSLEALVTGLEKLP